MSMSYREDIKRLEAINSALLEALQKIRSYNQDILAGRINYRPDDHIAVIDAAIARAVVKA